MSYLESICDPSALRKLTVSQLETYAQELRQYLIEVMSRAGGHVAANLGVVDLTVALHRVFATPDDKLVFDVGHQGYAHKIITGRRDRFETIRRDGGLSGFLRRSESIYDVFGAGHSSTSISAGCGLAEAERKHKTSNKVISIIGDGALTAGLAFEGLNHTAHLKLPNFAVIINDNDMSISENVSAVNALSAFVGALGFEYEGPVNGHDMRALISVFEQLRSRMDGRIASGGKAERPLIVHVKTKKGFGLKTAEQKPGAFHGVVGFDLQTGMPIKKKQSAPTYTEVFADTLCQLAQKDAKLVAITAAMADGTGLVKFQQLFDERFYDVGIAEPHAVTFAAALRLGGLRPAVAIYSTFMQRAYDQLLHDVALQKIPLALFLDRAGLVGADGPTHHGVFDLSYLRGVPGMHIMVPRDENELRHMVYTALYSDMLCAVRFPRGEGSGVKQDDNFRQLPMGKAKRLTAVAQKQVDVIFWSIGPMVSASLDAASLLQKKGVTAEVVNGRFVKPLDVSMLLDDSRRSRLIVTVEEGTVVGGFGSAVIESLAKQNCQASVLTLGVPDRFVEHGSVENLRKACGLDPESIASAALARLSS